MSDNQKTDAELLQCPPRLDATEFPKALANRKAKNFGKYLHLQIALNN